ncbi:MAG: AI-2E family transporter, partial [Tunicatimonas sp.]|uniref:AI-2E family transporter n=1 Tax=Tunicatimonas sp. TaxID=1940096 RepID=UPI003C72C32F
INYESLYARASAPLQNLEQFLRDNNITEKPPGFLVDDLRNSLLGFITKVEFQDIINSLISFTGNFFVGTLAIIFITFIFMYEKGLVRRQVIKLIPNQYFEVFIAAIYKIETLLSNYLIGLSFQVFAIFCIASLGLSILGVKYAFTIAIFAALANIIPYAGPIIGATFGIIVGLSTIIADGNTQEIVVLVVKILSVFTVVQLADNLLLQPLIFSKSVKAHPLEIFIIIFAGATVAGVIGMIVAIPVYTILRVVTTELYIGYRQYRVFKS